MIAASADIEGRGCGFGAGVEKALPSLSVGRSGTVSLGFAPAGMP